MLERQEKSDFPIYSLDRDAYSAWWKSTNCMEYPLTEAEIEKWQKARLIEVRAGLDLGVCIKFRGVEVYDRIVLSCKMSDLKPLVPGRFHHN